MTFIRSIDFAAVAGITRQKAHRALALAFRRGSTWRGLRLSVEARYGYGGKGGLHYVVQTESFPPDLQQRWQELSGPVEPALKVDDATMAVCQWRYALPSRAAVNRFVLKVRTG